MIAPEYAEAARRRRNVRTVAGEQMVTPIKPVEPVPAAGGRYCNQAVTASHPGMR